MVGWLISSLLTLFARLFLLLLVRRLCLSLFICLIWVRGLLRFASHGFCFGFARETKAHLICCSFLLACLLVCLFVSMCSCVLLVVCSFLFVSVCFVLLLFSSGTAPEAQQYSAVCGNTEPQQQQQQQQTNQRTLRSGALWSRETRVTVRERTVFCLGIVGGCLACPFVWLVWLLFCVCVCVCVCLSVCQ